MNAEVKLKRIKGILRIAKIDDERTSKKTLQQALKEIEEICEQDMEES